MIKVLLGIYKENHVVDMKTLKCQSREDAMERIEEFKNNPNYQFITYTNEQTEGTFKERYFVKFKRIA